MGQRVLPSRRTSSPAVQPPRIDTVPQLSVFLTDLGWFGLLGAGQVVCQLRIGHISAAEVRAAFGVAATKPRTAANSDAVRQNRLQWNPASERTIVTIDREIKANEHCSDESRSAADVVEADWFPELRERLQRYARGEETSFDDIIIQPARMTEFQRQVVAATRKLCYGQTVTYGALAERVGSPRAARAVGSVMAANRVPIIVPCHRVLAAGGKLGGFSAPQGIGLKERMLAMERGSTE